MSGRGLCSFLRIEGVKSRGKGTVGIQIIDAFAKVGGDLVDEEQREDLDTVFVNLVLFADVFADGFADHLAEDGFLVVANCFSQAQVAVVAEFNLLGLNADFVDAPVSFVCGVTSRQALKIRALASTNLPF